VCDSYFVVGDIVI